MMTRKNGLIYLTTILAFLLIGCQPNKDFKVEGTVSNASNDTLWLERSEINRNVKIDSLILSGEGRFSFSHPFENTEFYRLRIGKNTIPLIIDSIQTIKVTATKEEFSTKKYILSGSKTSTQIQNLLKIKKKKEKELTNLIDNYHTKQLNDSTFLVKLKELKETTKKEITPLILKHSNSFSSYYALFMRLGNYSLYAPFNKKDGQLYAAVANQFIATYSQLPRTKQLSKMVLQGIKLQNQKRLYKELEKGSKTMGAFDISLPNILGHEIALSSLKGKVILLDFTAYIAKFSPKRNREIYTLYNKYKNKGFTIYQISYDKDFDFWKQSADNLPWTCVYDKNNKKSKFLWQYNVKELPTYFLINRKGDVVKRSSTVKNLEKEITTLL